MADTFGKFKDSLNRGIASIGAKASTSVEKSKLKTQTILSEAFYCG